jgi:hemerythrin-like domain-containing protein
VTAEADEAASRRRFLAVAAASTGSLLAGCIGSSTAGTRRPSTADGDGELEAEVTPGEDLMQEHGVLERILLIYDEAVRRIAGGGTLDPQPVLASAQLVRRFVEDYHERLEERFVFPRLEAASREGELVATLREQHVRGRELTDVIVRLCQGPAGAGEALRDPLAAFVRMYRPHAAREETVLLPAFRALLDRAEYRELGEQFEDEEHERFGPRGFEDAVAEVANLEAALGLGDLSSFTPP